MVAVAVAFLVVAAAQMVPARPAAIGRRLEELQQMGTNPFGVTERRRRQERRERWEALLQSLGERAQGGSTGPADVRTRLVHAGYRRPNAAAVFTGARLALTLGLGLLAILVLPLFAPG